MNPVRPSSLFNDSNILTISGLGNNGLLRTSVLVQSCTILYCSKVAESFKIIFKTCPEADLDINLTGWVSILLIWTTSDDKCLEECVSLKFLHFPVPH